MLTPIIPLHATYYPGSGWTAWIDVFPLADLEIGNDGKIYLVDTMYVDGQLCYSDGSLL